jgi:hypothetical protein
MDLILNSLLVENEMVGKVGVTKYDLGLDIIYILCYIDIRFIIGLLVDLEQ